MGKRTTKLAATAAGALLLTGCYAAPWYDTNPAPGEQDFEVSLPDEGPGTVADEEAFLADLRRQDPAGYAAVESDRTAIAYGYGACKLFDDGETIQDAVARAVSAGGDGDEALVQFFGFAALAAAKHLCPEHWDDVREQLGG